MNQKFIFKGNKNDGKEVSHYLTRVADEFRNPFSDIKDDRKEIESHIQDILGDYISMQARNVASYIKAKDDILIIKNIMATRVLTELDKYNDPSFLKGRAQMSFDTFFGYFVKRPAIKEYFKEKRNLKTYEIDGIMHIEAVKEYLINTYGADADAISAEDVFIHQGETGRKTSLPFDRIKRLMEIMEDPMTIESGDECQIGEYDPGLLAIEKKETAKELIEFMNALGRVEKVVFVMRFPDEEQMTYKEIGHRSDVLAICKGCKYKRHVVNDSYVDNKFLEDQYRSVVRKLRRFITENDLSVADLMYCIGNVIDSEREKY